MVSLVPMIHSMRASLNITLYNPLKNYLTKIFSNKYLRVRFLFFLLSKAIWIGVYVAAFVMYGRHCKGKIDKSRGCTSLNFGTLVGLAVATFAIMLYAFFSFLYEVAKKTIEEMPTHGPLLLRRVFWLDSVVLGVSLAITFLLSMIAPKSGDGVLYSGVSVFASGSFELAMTLDLSLSLTATMTGAVVGFTGGMFNDNSIYHRFHSFIALGIALFGQLLFLFLSYKCQNTDEAVDEEDQV